MQGLSPHKASMLGDSTPEVSKVWVVSIYSEKYEPAAHETLLKMSPASASHCFVEVEVVSHCFVEVAGRPQNSMARSLRSVFPQQEDNCEQESTEQPKPEDKGKSARVWSKVTSTALILWRVY